MPELLLINPNTSASMTEKMCTAATSVLAPDSNLECMTSEYGPPSIEGFYDEVFAVPPLLDLIRHNSKGKDAIIVGCFDDTGIEAARCISEAPVIGICQAACQLATILAPSFSIVTTLSRSITPLQKRVLDYGFERHCRSVRASDIPVLELEQCGERAMTEILRQCELAIHQDGCESIVLGCAGMVDLQLNLQQKLGIPVIESVTAAVSIMQGLSRLPLSTSRANAFANPVAKDYVGIFNGYSPDNT